MKFSKYSYISRVVFPHGDFFLEERRVVSFWGVWRAEEKRYVLEPRQTLHAFLMLVRITLLSPAVMQRC